MSHYIPTDPSHCVLTNFENYKIRNIFACGATTSDAMTKWMMALDSTCRIDLKKTSLKLFNSSNNV